jgi:hypothetical protein
MYPNVYFSETIPMTSLQAIACADAWYGQLEPVGLRGGWVRATDELRLRQGCWSNDCDPISLRHVLGRLWLGSFSIAMELELLAHSEDRCELALHPFTLRWPVGAPRFENRARDAISTIRTGLEMTRQDQVSAAVRSAIDLGRAPRLSPANLESRLVHR